MDKVTEIMATARRNAAIELIEDAIGDDELYEFITARSGEFLGVYADGSVSVGESVGDEIDPSERPIVLVACPGDTDRTWWLGDHYGWSDDDEAYVVIHLDADDVGRVIGDFDAVVRDCIDNGDVSTHIEDLRRVLILAYQDQEADNDRFGR